MMLKLVVLGLNVLFVAGQCPTQFEQNGDSCYHFSHDAETWVSALEICSSMYMSNLVVVDNNKESQYISQRMGQLGQKAYWLGANDIITEGTWVMGNSHTNITFTAWLPGEPNNVDGKENCAIAVTGGWYDIQCSSHVPYICEKPVHKPI